MDGPQRITAEFDDVIAARIHGQHQEIAARWFERLSALLPVGAREIFPTSALLDHIPELIVEIATFLRDPALTAISANTAVLEKARELGDLRHGQRASLHQVLREFQILGAVLTTFVIEEAERLPLSPPVGATAALVHRLQEAVNVLSQATVETFVGLYTATIQEQSKRLEEFTRLAAHEWRQPLNTLQVSFLLLRHPELEASRASRTWDSVERNLKHLISLTKKLELVARLRDDDTPLLQRVSLTAVANEAARQLRDMADAKDVRVVVAEGMPELTLDVGRLELALINLLSNGIKYADPAKREKHVQVSAAPDEREGWWCLFVRDNGIGIPQQALTKVFRRFTRVHADIAGIPGIGLGLAIVDECVRTLGGEIGVESVEGEGTTFILFLPC